MRMKNGFWSSCLVAIALACGVGCNAPVESPALATAVVTGESAAPVVAASDPDCTPSCDNKICGAADGCGGQCGGSCPPTKICTSDDFGDRWCTSQFHCNCGGKYPICLPCPTGPNGTSSVRP
jgi:hypothetical protein